jgi:hypothetical protein
VDPKLVSICADIKKLGEHISLVPKDEFGSSVVPAGKEKLNIKSFYNRKRW